MTSFSSLPPEDVETMVAEFSRLLGLDDTKARLAALAAFVRAYAYRLGLDRDFADALKAAETEPAVDHAEMLLRLDQWSNTAFAREHGAPSGAELLDAAFLEVAKNAPARAPAQHADVHDRARELADIITSFSDGTVDPALKDIVRAWPPEPSALNMLEALDAGIHGSLAPGAVIYAMQVHYDDLCKAEGVTHDQLVPLATWRDTMGGR